MSTATLESVTAPADVVMDAVARLDAVDSFISRLTQGSSKWGSIGDSLLTSTDALRAAAFGDRPETDEEVAIDPTLIELEIRGSEIAAEMFEAIGLKAEAAHHRAWAALIRDEGHMRDDVFRRAPWHGTSPEAYLKVVAD